MFGLRKRLRNDKDLRCSFCNKPQEKVEKLIANRKETPATAYICNECVAVCVLILKEDKKNKGPR
jgi:ATP-dependent Clp protease ATP-binding subunit ClpX